MSETVEISKETLEVLYGNYDGNVSRDSEHLNEAEAVLKAAESDRFSVNIDTDTDNANDPQTHDFDEGEYALDTNEPTPSPEANTVEILETTGQRANEYVVEETGKTVAEHNPARPSDDLVVVGHYPHMGGDKNFAFPESRLRRV